MKKGFLTLVIAAAALHVHADRQPNIVVILADDMGWGDVGYHGFTDVHTPNIDKLARSGTWFEQGYVTASVCGPSRAGIVSGVYQQRFGFYGNGEKFILPLDQPTLAERLKARGYATGMLGKWHVGHQKEELPNARGFDFYYGALTGSHDYFRSSANPNEKKRALLPILRNGEIEPPLQERGENLTRVYGEEAAAFIERNKDNPFFLYVSHNAVHFPWQADDKDIERLKKLKVHHEERRYFAAMVLALDDSVGLVMDSLKQHRLERDTLVFFLTDNGTPCGQGFEPPRQKTRGTTTMSSPGGWNGFKGDTYDGGTRVPFLVSWPGQVPAGKSYPLPVSSLDIAATAMAVSSGPELQQGLPLDGVNLLPYISGRKDGRPHDTLYWRRGDDYAVRKHDWKLVYNDGKPTGSRRIELFNLKDDPGETTDLAGRQPERAQMLQNLFDEWDSALPESMAGIANPQNRNVEYSQGCRVNVTGFNAE